MTPNFSARTRKAHFPRVVCAAALAFFLLSCGTSSGVNKPPSMREKTLRGKIAQMLLLGFRGGVLKPEMEIYSDIRERGIGGVILFDRDSDGGSAPRNIFDAGQLETLCHSLQSISEIPLFIAIDQEGGAVNRLRNIRGFDETPTARELHAADAQSSGAVLAESLRTAAFLSGAGINLNFAPCVDLDINPDNPVIGKYGRAYSSNPADVTAFAEAWIAGHRAYGVFSCIKHFPGHGSSRSDSHRGAVDVSSLWRWEELMPYRELISGGLVDFIMTSHVYNAVFDRKYPATLSSATIGGLLRGDLAYRGIIVSDDLDMGAISEVYSRKEALTLAVNAGVDILCLSNNGTVYRPKLAAETISILEKQVKKGKIDKTRIDQSYARIIKAKTFLFTKK